MPEKLPNLIEIAVKANQQALNGLAKLHNYSVKNGREAEFLRLINRTFSLEGNSKLSCHISKVEEVCETEHHPPLWATICKAVKEIFERFESQELVWVSSSINPAEKRNSEGGRALGFEDVVVVHSADHDENGLGKLLEENFKTIARCFLDQLGDDAVSHLQNLPQQSGISGLSLVEKNEFNFTQPDPGFRIWNLNVGDNHFNELKSIPNSVFAGAIKQWSNHWETVGSFESYFKTFGELRGGDNNGNQKLIFCPVTYFDLSGKLAAGANISLGYKETLNDEQLRHIIIACSVLQSGLASSVAAFNDVHKRLIELKRSQAVLDHLKQPLREFRSLFNQAQGFNQEMWALLNEPEEGIFGLHDIVAPIFDESKQFSISPNVQLRIFHEWDVGDGELDSSSITTAELRMGIMLFCCLAFGELDRLSSVASTEEFLYESKLIVARNSHRPLKEKVVESLKRVFSLRSDEEFCEVGSQRADEDVSDFRLRISRYLRTIKALCHRPFKVGETNLPESAIRFVVDDSFDWLNYKPKDDEAALYSWSPVSPQGVLQFLCILKSFGEDGYLNLDAKPELLADTYGAGKTWRCISLDLSKAIVGSPSQFNRQQLLLKVDLESDMKGKVYGDFRNLFAGLIRHIVVPIDDSSEGDAWNPDFSKCEVTNLPDNVDLMKITSPQKNVFKLTQQKVGAGKYKLSICWEETE